MNRTERERPDLPPSSETAAGLSLAAQIVCFKLTLDQPHSALTIALRALAMGFVVGWMVALARGHATRWPARMTVLALNVASALCTVIAA